MTNEHDDLAAKIADLDARLREVEALQTLTLRILSTTKPLDAVLAQFGATQTQQDSLYRLLDDMAVRTRGPERERPTYRYLAGQIGEIFERREDPAFVDLVVGTLKIERPLYRDLHSYMQAQGWLK
jgi:hypothetical protein